MSLPPLPRCSIRSFYGTILLACLQNTFVVAGQPIEKPASAATVVSKGKAYLFTSFRGDGEDGLRLAFSTDAFAWHSLPGSFLRPAVGPSNLLRDPSVVRGPDGTYHMVWTTGWRGDQGFGYASTRDFLRWSKQRFIPAMQHEPTTVNVWAPELYYDAKETRFVICWASTIPGRFPNRGEPNDNNQRMYYTTTKDFRKFEPTKLFFDPNFNVIDCFIVPNGSQYTLVLKDNSREVFNLRTAVGKTPLGPWQDVSNAFTEKYTEGPTVLKVGEAWLIYYDLYRKNAYGAMKTSDFKTFTDVTNKMTFPKGHKHGTTVEISTAELAALIRGVQGKAGFARAKDMDSWDDARVIKWMASNSPESLSKTSE